MAHFVVVLAQKEDCAVVAAPKEALRNGDYVRRLMKVEAGLSP